MSYYSVVIVDTSLLVAFYDAQDSHHFQVCDFFASCRSDLVTTLACATEVMWLLSSNWRLQNEFLSALADEIYKCEPLTSGDFARIAELNAQYADLPGDFADLSLIVISERFDIAAVATLDKDFDIYRRYRHQPFERVFRP